MQATGILKFCFLKPFLIGVYTFVFCTVLILTWYGFSYGFMHTLEVFRIQWSSPGIIILVSLCIITSISSIIKNCYVWKMNSDKYNKKKSTL